MAGVYVLVLCGLSSAAAVWLGRRRGLRAAALLDALGHCLECVGLAVVLLAANVALGMAIVLGLRVLSGRFLSLYANADITLLVLSLLQAIALSSWWRTERRH
jgi:hypothetical protein